MPCFDFATDQELAYPHMIKDHFPVEEADAHIGEVTTTPANFEYSISGGLIARAQWLS